MEYLIVTFIFHYHRGAVPTRRYDRILCMYTCATVSTIEHAGSGEWLFKCVVEVLKNMYFQFPNFEFFYQEN